VTSGGRDPSNLSAVERLLRDLAPQVLAAVARRHGDFDSAEDAVQEALVAASTRWPAEGIPSNPRGWLYHVALRRITDHLRSELARRRREDSAAVEVFAEWAFVPPPDTELVTDRDDTLALVFMCCHPALTSTSAIALTLRAVGGLTTAEIASAFLVPEATMAQRISRAKQSIKASGVPFTVPDDADRAERLNAVLQILYLIFNEGYSSSAGSELHRPDLTNEAIRLARMLRDLVPTEPEAAGLLALMLLTDARRAARTDAGGAIVPLDEQDRALWNRALIAEGTTLLAETLAGGSAGPYQIQAAIAALHDEAPSVEQTDWRQIHALYETLRDMVDNPVVSLNQAVAAAMVRGPAFALEQLARLERDPRIAGHYRLDAVRGHLYEMAGDPERARLHYRAAADRTASLPERNYLTAKAARIAGGP
jgi:RNA polymerase sigma factor (sigma-70 family)